MNAISFAELTKQVHLINDLILSDMVCDKEDSEEALSFSKHLLATKYWFARISWANKKRYLLALLEDVHSAWALSLLLKSMWNCRPKDAVLSICEANLWSSYDQVPMDHNRTAQPHASLAQVMRNDRMWFLTLEPEIQALVLSELLTVAGGPVMWAVYRRAQFLYERYRNDQLQNLLECIIVNDQPDNKNQASSTEKGKKDQLRPKSTDALPTAAETNKQSPGQKELEASLAAWNATIKSMRDSLKLEELEMTFNDGTKRKIWKVNRPKPEAIETVDFIQLLPSSVGKRIVSYLPRAHLGDYARVNKYWAYLIDEFKIELNARQKINADLEKLQELMLRHDTSMEMLGQIDFVQFGAPSSQIVSLAPSTRMRQPLPSMRASEKSAGACSFRHFMTEKISKSPIGTIEIPIRNVAELSERLDRRGAADENLWKWCENILKRTKHHRIKKEKRKTETGILPLDNLHFPCPMMKEILEVPLSPPLFKDPSVFLRKKPRKNISNATLLNAPKHSGAKRFSLWTRNLSSLYPVYKIPSYLYPV